MLHTLQWLPALEFIALEAEQLRGAANRLVVVLGIETAPHGFRTGPSAANV